MVYGLCRAVVQAMRKKQQACMVGGGRTVTPDEAEEIAARLYTRKPERPQARSSLASLSSAVQALPHSDATTRMLAV